MNFNIKRQILVAALASFLLLRGCYPSKLFAQDKAISVSLIPEIGFDHSYFHLTDPSERKAFRYTTKLLGIRKFYWSIGLQLGLWDQWKATLTLGQTYNGGGYTYRVPSLPNLPKALRFNGWSLKASCPVDLMTLNFNKKIWQFPIGRLKGTQFASELDIIFGAGFLWIPGYKTTSEQGFDTGAGGPDGGFIYNDYQLVVIPKNQGTGILNLGFSYQLLINKKARFVFGARYSYGLQPSWLLKYKMNYYFENKDLNITDQSNEHFEAETSRHQFTIFIGYPIALYRNKAEKNYLKK